ncbi:MAG: CDP-glycerol glycerophosphotransferase family protein [Bacteroidales bacterium]|jgi:CDP-glycerol glycerophosphotransferase (TagB/SpsB family)|nr:CDP-glycerol glycerophosphotransferase family protein [Bacteroidales bacterium]
MKQLERLISVVTIIFGWLLIVPVSLLVPKKKGLYILIGRDASYYSDNTKYFNNYLLNLPYQNAHFVFETKNPATQSIPNAVFYPSWRAVFLLMRADYLIVDTSTWFYNFKSFFAIKAAKIQLWHGVSSKKIELDTDQFTKSKWRFFRKCYGILRGQIVRYELIASTSDYYSEHLYKNAFRHKSILPIGQSRNDIFFRELNDVDFINADKLLLDRLIKQPENEKTKIVLYTPTYRTHLSMNFIDFARMNQFCQDNKLLLVLKYHILSPVPYTENLSNVFIYDKSKDVYPLMKICDAMITDYSSIYIDYLLTNRPVIFFIPDFEAYQKQEVGLRTDFYQTAPGEKCINQIELETALKACFNGKDNYQAARKDILNLSFTYQDGKSSERLFTLLRK